MAEAKQKRAPLLSRFIVKRQLWDGEIDLSQVSKDKELVGSFGKARQLGRLGVILTTRADVRREQDSQRKLKDRAKKVMDSFPRTLNCELGQAFVKPPKRQVKSYYYVAIGFEGDGYEQLVNERNSLLDAFGIEEAQERPPHLTLYRARRYENASALKQRLNSTDVRGSTVNLQAPEPISVPANSQR